MASLTDWPKDEYESVGHCPICSSKSRELMHEGLVDHLFASPLAEWTMHRCRDCGCGYLDPRPSLQSIGLAYASYYTHNRASGGELGRLARVRRGVAESYANHVYGTKFTGELPAGHFVARIFPRMRRYLDVTYARHLPRPDMGSRRLLDVGCGNGEFLQCASALGWNAEGIDPDAAAVAAASEAGCAVKMANLDNPDLKPASYQHITMSHVIEHVASPRRQLQRCLELLAPGGRLWLETPNVDSLGHRLFGPAWRGLEPPRHFLLFNREALRNALSDAGFCEIEFKSHPGVAMFIWEGSHDILRRMGTPTRTPVIARMMRSLVGAIIADYWSSVSPGSSEFITCVARRPVA